jgi:hypothetical protein
MKVNRKTSTLLFASCFALSLTVTVLLTRHSERSSVTNSKLLTTRDVHGLSLGETVSVPTFETFNGPAQSVTAGPSGYTLLIIFSTHCEACQRDSAFWNKLAAEAVKTKTSYYLVCANSARDEIENFVDRFGLGNHTILIDAENELPTILKTMFVPQYLLIDNQGRVAGRWLGLSHSDPQGVKALEVSDILKPTKQL